MKNQEVKSTLLPFNLQFFADGGSTSKEDTKGAAENNDGNDDEEGEEEELEDEGEDGDSEEDTGKKTKTKDKKLSLTQTQLTRMMAKEKKEGRKSILSKLGFKSEEEAQSAAKLLSTLLESQKTDEQKKADAEKNLQSANERALMAEYKLSCVLNGVSKDSIDDVLAIAMSKVDEDTTLDDVLESMKKEARYKGFFQDGSSSEEGESKGTGRTPNQKKGSKTNNGEYGKTLAERNRPGASKTEGKKTYF